MSNASDPFFEEEEELARSQASSAKASKGSKGASASGKAAPKGGPVKTGGRKPPSFGLAVAIAVVALLLGVGIGYFAAMAVVDRSDGANPSAATVPAATTAGEEAESGELPSGHPDIASMMNPDGTVNEEAVEAFKASRAAQDSSSAGDTAGSES